jgi:hypothetical protein
MPQLQLASSRDPSRGGACCRTLARAAALDTRMAFLQPCPQPLRLSRGPLPWPRQFHTPPPRTPKSPKTPKTLPELCPGSTGLGTGHSQESQDSQDPPESLSGGTGLGRGDSQESQESQDPPGSLAGEHGSWEGVLGRGLGTPLFIEDSAFPRAKRMVFLTFRANPRVLSGDSASQDPGLELSGRSWESWESWEPRPAHRYLSKNRVPKSKNPGNLATSAPNPAFYRGFGLPKSRKPPAHLGSLGSLGNPPRPETPPRLLGVLGVLGTTPRPETPPRLLGVLGVLGNPPGTPHAPRGVA